MKMENQAELNENVVIWCMTPNGIYKREAAGGARESAEKRTKDG